MTRDAREEKRVLVRYDALCLTLNQNEVPLLTITAPELPDSPLQVKILTLFIYHPNKKKIIYFVILLMQ